MTANLKSYRDYKDSGVPWLGNIPAHWRQLPGRACFAEKKTPNVGMQETTVLSLSYGQIVVKPPEKLHGLVPASFETYQIIEPYDVVIRPTDLQNDKVSLRTGLARTKGIITSAYMCLRTEDALAQEYGHLLLHAYDLKKVFYGLGSGLRQNLSWRDFKYLPCLVPPQDEQSAIARFLDYIDRRTRHYVRAQRKLITLLEEQNQAIIQRAVSRGLDPNVRLKPSGVEWLGQIPEHWEIVPLKFLCRLVQNGATPPTAEESFYRDGAVPWFGPSSIGSEVEVSAPVRYLAEIAFTRGKARLIRGPAILIIIIGATAAKMAALMGEGSTNQQITAYELRTDRVEPVFVLHQLRNSETWLRSTASTATIPILKADIVSRLPVVFPSLEEQRQILERLTPSIEAIESSISRSRRQIDLIREYRTRLIADVVTGKLDVRQAAANLPEEAQEPEDWDETEELDEDETMVADDQEEN